MQTPTPRHRAAVNPLLEQLRISPSTRAMLNQASTVDPADRLHLGLNKKGDKFLARIYNDSGNFPGGLSSRWATSTPGTKALVKHPKGSGNWYTMQPGDFTVLRTLNSWDPDKLTFENEFSNYRYNDILMRFVAGEVNARRVYQWKELQQAPPVNYHLHPLPERRLNPYQCVGVTNSLATPGFALFMEQGTGKTPIVITRTCHDAIAKVAAGEGYYRGVIVCPANLLHNWVSEFRKFSTCPLDVEAIEGDRFDRLSTVRRLFVDGKAGHYGGVAVMSYRTAIAMASVLELLQIQVDFACVDESHTIKNPQAAVTKGMFKLRDCSTKRMVLTGTPIGNSPLDLWTQLEFLYEGCSGFTDYASFKKYYARFVVAGDSGIERLDELANVPLLQEKLARNSFVIRKDEALPHLPDKNYDVLTCLLGKQQQRMYDKLATELALSIQADLDRAEKDSRIRSIAINNALTKALKLTQITSGFLKWDPVVDEETGLVLQESHIEPTPENTKLDLLLEQLAAMDKHSKAIIWNVQIWPLRMLYTKLTALGYNPVMYYGATTSDKRQEAVAAFNDERLRGLRGIDPSKDPTTCRVFLGQTKAAGPGLNLLGYPPGDPDASPMNADRVFRFSRDYSFLNEAQSDDRSHRIGSRKPVQVTSLLCNRTIDMSIHSRIDEKRDTALDIQDVRQILIDLGAN